MRLLLPFLLLLFLLPTVQAAPWDGADPADVTFHLVTADPGHHLGSAWYGHSGLLVERDGETRYYAYRLHIVDSPYRAAITAFGDVPFSMHDRPFQAKLDEYTEQQRSMRTVELLLDADEKGRLIAGIEAELANKENPHVYRMIHDNCSTQLRDLLDAAIVGGLPGLDVPIGATVRDIAGPDYVEHDVVQANLLYLLMGPDVDQPLNRGDTLFLPLELESYLQEVGRAGEPVTLLSFPYPQVGPGHDRIVAVAAAVGLMLAAPIVGLGLLHRRGDATARPLLGGWMASLGLLLLVPAIIIAVSWSDALAQHFHDNVNILLVPPFIAAWIVVGTAWARGAAWSGPATTWLSRTQLVLAGAALLLHLAGAQVMDSSLALLLPVHVATWFAFTVCAVPADSAQPRPADATPAPRVE